ncbi:MAG: mechanosensitive ion channel family protein [Clostridia bacterium]|nr:mechanosensitive ion channel family protein [Clostridia bacterium]
MEKLLKSIFDTTELNAWQAFLAKYLPLVIGVIIAIIAIKYIMNIVTKLIKKSKMPKSVHAFAASTVKIFLYFIVVMIACSYLGIDVTTLVATFSIVGVAVSLSIQNTLANVMAGLSLLFTKQFGVDDYVEVAGISGTVVRIGLFNCRLRTPDGKDIYVPNSSIIAENVTNYSREPRRRVDITIGTSYSESVDRVKDTLMQVINETPEVLKDQDIFCGITSFGDSSINYTIRVWVKNGDYWKAYLPMLERIKRIFEKENIEIPFNQLDVHVKKDE